MCVDGFRIIMRYSIGGSCVNKIRSMYIFIIEILKLYSTMPAFTKKHKRSSFMYISILAYDVYSENHIYIGALISALFHPRTAGGLAVIKTFQWSSPDWVFPRNGILILYFTWSSSSSSIVSRSKFPVVYVYNFTSRIYMHIYRAEVVYEEKLTLSEDTYMYVEVGACGER